MKLILIKFIGAAIVWSILKLAKTISTIILIWSSSSLNIEGWVCCGAPTSVTSGAAINAGAGMVVLMA